MIHLTQPWIVFLSGSLVPLFVAVLARANASSSTRALLNVILSIVAGVIAFLSQHAGVASFLDLASAAVAAYLAAVASYHSLWKPTGVTGAINAKTPNVLIG